MSHYYGQPLAVEVVDGQLVIRIGVNTLAHAVRYSDWANPYDEKRRDYIRTFAITDPTQFANDVRYEMGREKEDGSTPLSDFLDKMAQEAINQGSTGLSEDAQCIKSGATSPLEMWANEGVTEHP